MAMRKLPLAKSWWRARLNWELRGGAVAPGASGQSAASIGWNSALFPRVVRYWVAIVAGLISQPSRGWWQVKQVRPLLVIPLEKNALAEVSVAPADLMAGDQTGRIRHGDVLRDRSRDLALEDLQEHGRRDRVARYMVHSGRCLRRCKAIADQAPPSEYRE
jgi:hypothetical protein